ncbi:MAG TPA: NADH-quinone oxidoreductase subunit H [Candidatus Saccharimonadales bacterium]|nr:NADH-quinone oxidoreductase subunit H [Candidatus Saccharimonadales bacterium]
MILIILKIVLLPLLSPLCIGIVRKIKAYMQNRQGASILQPYFDLWKLFHKDEVIARDASWIFRLMPYFIFSISILLPLGIPLLSHVELVSTFGDFLVIIYLLALMTFFLALAGIDTGSAFGGFGSSREMTLAALTEGNLVFSILPVALITHSTNLVVMASAAAQLPANNYFPIIFAFLGFFIALTAETGRVPFDNPATHLELTMIHEAMILEYSGKRLALIEWTNANKFLFFALLGVNIFFPWNANSSSTIPALLITGLLVVLKVVLLIGAVAILESSIAKFRLFRLPDLLLTGFIFCIIALIASVVPV